MITYIALGTNLGVRSDNLIRARELLSERVKIVRASSIYETEPWGVTDQPAFLNQVVEGQTELGALELLQFLKKIEKAMGRKKTIRYGPRIIDLDILLLGELQLHTPELTLPHSRMSGRAFVLAPLAEIAPLLKLPGINKTVVEVLSTLDTSGVRRLEEQA